jgi:hypothetical protein
MTNTFIVSWDMTGLEAVVDITENIERGDAFEREKIWDIIKDPEHVPQNEWARGVNQMLHHMILRARANTHRHYEIYSIQTNQGITKADLEDMFNNSPQAAADLIRDRGVKFYSDRVNKRTQVIE